MAKVQKELDALLELLNSTPDEPQRRYPEIGYYYAMSAYGGAKLVQIINEGGGVRDVMPHLGYVNRPTLVKALRSFLAGRWEAAEEQRRQIRQERAVRATEYAAAYWASQQKPKRRRATATA